MALSTDSEAHLQVDHDNVIVTAPGLVTDRSARLFFNAIIGASPTQNGWRCPRRNLSVSTLVVRVNSFLENRGLTVRRVGLADEAIQREIERKRSFERARQAALALREGAPSLNVDAVKRALHDSGWSEANRNLYPHQEIGLMHGLTVVNAANFSVPGAGKTATTLAVAMTHIANATVDVVVVVGPLSCFAPWEKETRAALVGVLATVRVRGGAAARRETYLGVRPRHILLMSYATAAADKVELIDLCRRYKVMLVVDESHRVKRFRGGLWAPALMEVAKHARVRLILSGTPMPQSGRDLYSQLRILWPGGELTGPPDDFATRVDSNFSSILAEIRPFASRTPKQALGLQPYRVVRHTVNLSTTQAEIYELIEGRLRRVIEDAATWRDKLEALRRGRLIRLLQAAANPDLLNKIDGFYRLPRFQIPNPTLLQRLADYRHIETPAKSQRALEIITDIVMRADQTGGKTVCWSSFVHNLDQFTELVRQRLGLPVFQIDGRVPAGDQPADDGPYPSSPPDVDTREAVIDRFLHTAGPATLIANPASTSESISLHESCHNAIYLDRTYDCALYLQSIDRIHRLGLRPGQDVEVHTILATRDGRRTIDHLVDQSLAAKEAAMRQVLEGADLAPLQEPDDPLASAEGTDQDLNNLLRYLLGEDTADVAAL